MKKRCLNTIEAAAYIGLSGEFLRKARVNGPSNNGTPAPQFIKLGRCVRYLIEDLDQYLDRQTKLICLAEQYIAV